MIRRSLLLITATMLIAFLCAAQAAMKVSDVVDMLQAGLPEDLVTTKLRKANHAFDLSAQEMVQLKKSGVSDNVIKAMLDPSAPATVTAPSVSILGLPGPKSSGATPQSGASEISIAANINDPTTAHDSGIYLYTEKSSQKVMLPLERAAYRGTKGNYLGHAMTYGIMKAKVRAVIPGPRATLRSSDPRPVFYFYFEEKSAGLGKSGFGVLGAQTVSNPGQFGLVKLETKKDSRETLLYSLGFASTSSGSEDKSLIAFATERVRPGVYRVIPTVNMEPGEYCFMASGPGPAGVLGSAAAADLFDFSITSNN